MNRHFFHSACTSSESVIFLYDGRNGTDMDRSAPAQPAVCPGVPAVADPQIETAVLIFPAADRQDPVPVQRRDHDQDRAGAALLQTGPDGSGTAAGPESAAGQAGFVKGVSRSLAELPGKKGTVPQQGVGPPENPVPVFLPAALFIIQCS